MRLLVGVAAVSLALWAAAAFVVWRAIQVVA